MCSVFLCVPTMVWLAVFGILLIPTSVCSIFVCPNTGMASSVWDTTHSHQCSQYFCVSQHWDGCQCLRFLICTHMLMLVTGCRGGTNIPCRTKESNLHQYCTWLFGVTLFHLRSSSGSFATFGGDMVRGTKSKMKKRREKLLTCYVAV